MRILTVDSNSPAAETVTAAAEAMRNGGMLAYLTDTMYGLGVDARNESAIARLYALKRRTLQKAIPIIAGRRQQLAGWIEDFPLLAQKLAAQYWPGPLTMIFRAGATVSRMLTAGGGTLAVRVPNSMLARALSLQLGAPITATSANLSGDSHVLSVDEIVAQLGDEIDLVLDSGRVHSVVPSTIVDVTCTPFRVVRRGVIETHALQRITGAIST